MADNGNDNDNDNQGQQRNNAVGAEDDVRPPDEAAERLVPPAAFFPYRILILNFRGIQHLVQLAYPQAQQTFYSAVAAINRHQRLVEQHAEEANEPQQDPAQRVDDALILDTTQSITGQVLAAARVPRRRRRGGADDGAEEDANDGEDVEEEPNIPLPTRIDQYDHNTFRVYDKAFIASSVPIPPQDQEQQARGQEDRGPGQRPVAALRPVPLTESHTARVAAVILFNAGLTHHLRGLSNVQTQVSDYQRSLQFYQIALRLLRDLAVVAPGRGAALAFQPPQAAAQQQGDNNDERGVGVVGGGVRLLLLALYNNLAHIRQHFFDTRQFQECLDALRQILLTGHRSSEDTHFALNLLVSQEGVSFAAAMA